MAISPFRKFLNWLSLPPACPKHGRAHLFQHGWEMEWECMMCWKERHPNMHQGDWQSDRESYLAGDR